MISTSPCGCHVGPVNFMGTIIVGSGDVVTNSLPTARFGDVAVSTCGHIITLITGSGSVVVNSLATHRMGGYGVNCGGAAVTVGSAGNAVAGG